MKSLISKTALGLIILAFNFGCKETTEEVTAPSESGKVLLSSWAVSNQAWAIRLDLSGANSTGSSFSMTIKFSDTSETHCTAVITGDDVSGVYNISACASTTPGSGSMSDVVGGPAFETGGNGTYSNDGTDFTWCRANTACFTYH